jgi:hypothetical protein
MQSRRRQTAAVFFFDSASPFRGSPERSGGNPRSVTAKHLRMHPKMSQHWDIALGNARGAEIIQI